MWQSGIHRQLHDHAGGIRVGCHDRSSIHGMAVTMKRIFLAGLLCAAWSVTALAQNMGGGGLDNPSSSGSGGSGTVTSVSVTTANGVSGTVATPTTTPAISLTLGAITPSSAAIGAGSAITSSGPGGVLGTGAFAAVASGANPTATAGPSAVNGSAPTFMRSDGAPAVQKGSSSQFGIVE